MERMWHVSGHGKHNETGISDESKAKKVGLGGRAPCKRGASYLEEEKYEEVIEEKVKNRVKEMINSTLISQQRNRRSSWSKTEN